MKYLSIIANLQYKIIKLILIVKYRLNNNNPLIFRSNNNLCYKQVSKNKPQAFINKVSILTKIRTILKVNHRDAL